jgi:hypothetical protein
MKGEIQVKDKWRCIQFRTPLITEHCPYYFNGDTITDDGTYRYIQYCGGHASNESCKHRSDRNTCTLPPNEAICSYDKEDEEECATYESDWVCTMDLPGAMKKLEREYHDEIWCQHDSPDPHPDYIKGRNCKNCAQLTSGPPVHTKDGKLPSYSCTFKRVNMGSKNRIYFPEQIPPSQYKWCRWAPRKQKKKNKPKQRKLL